MTKQTRRQSELIIFSNFNQRLITVQKRHVNIQENKVWRLTSSKNLQCLKTVFSTNYGYT